MRERTGLLNEQGQDCYAFVHKTFQEYLCSQEIDYQRDNEQDFGIVITHISDHLHNPHWREVLLLLIAQQKPKPAAKAIRQILNQNSLYESWLHRDLLFAGSCLAENPKDLKVNDPELLKEILEKLVELEVDDSERVGNKVRQQIFQIICRLSESDFQDQALQLLKDRKDDINVFRLLDYQAALGEQEEVIKILLEKLKTQDYRVRSSAADALGNLGNTSETVVTALLEKLKDHDDEVCYSAAFALGNLGNASETVVTALLEKLKEQNDDVCYSAANALGNLGNASETVVTALLEKLKDQDFLVRSNAANALGKLGNTSETVVTALLEKLKEQNDDVRYSAANALGKLGNTSETVVTALLKLLKAQKFFVRYSAAEALGKLGKKSSHIAPAVVQWIEHHQDSDYVGAGIDALWDLVVGED